MDKEAQKGINVIIVGGSIAGLTLAHCLRHRHIRFTVLESSFEIAVSRGASIGLLPSGLRILDQLGMFDELSRVMTPVQVSSLWTETGSLIKKEYPRILQERHGYPFAFLPRKALVTILYEGLREDKTKVFLNKKVINTELVASGVVVKCADDTQYIGNIVIGADGIRSTVRQNMWREMKAMQSGRVAEKKEPSLVPGHSHHVFGSGFCLIAMASKHNSVYWFLIAAMAGVYDETTLPRYTSQDLKNHVARFLHVNIAPGIQFQTLYHGVASTAYVPLEQVVYEHWSFGRYACIGDAIHKMVPNTAEGGNSAIESAASLANHIIAFLDSPDTHPYSFDNICRCLSTWEKERQPRVKEIWRKANNQIRFETCASVGHTLIMQYFLPYAGRYLINNWSKSLVGAERVTSIPNPARSMSCSVPFDDRYRNIHDESWWRRLAWAFPLVVCVLQAWLNTTTARSPDLGTDIAANSAQQYIGGSFNPFRIILALCSNDMDAQDWLQLLFILANIAPVYISMFLDSYSRPSRWTTVFRLALLGVVYRLFGLGVAATSYFSLGFLTSPLSELLATEYRMANPSAVRNVLKFAPLLASCLLTSIGLFHSESLFRSQESAIKQLLSFLGPLVHMVLFIIGSTKYITAYSAAPSINHRRTVKTYICLAFIILAGITGLVSVYQRCSSLGAFSILTASLGGGQHLLGSKRIACSLQADVMLALESGLVWLSLSFRDIQLYGKPVSWFRLVGLLVTACWAIGPGGAFALGWCWRERMLDNIRR
ncbi:hypothetical protein BBP40_009822 [Aspergillus hancockii]|nr:hypothetical protein BBP40_009822 [Aspergillus hancockii]